MIRPRLVLMAGSFGTDRDDVRERLYKLAAVVEMTHLASLIHDDIVDDAPFRRGKPSVQSKYGKNAAVYAGDFLMSRITFYLMREGLNRSGMIISQAVEEMCAGEIGQAMCRYKEDVTLDEYLQNIHGKTVALFRACCRIGAMESGCDERVSRMLESFGECLGYMFQMRDDLLDFVPDSSMIGKKATRISAKGSIPCRSSWHGNSPAAVAPPSLYGTERRRDADSCGYLPHGRNRRRPGRHGGSVESDPHLPKTGRRNPRSPAVE